MDPVSRAQNNEITTVKRGFQPGNQYRMKPGETRNPGGRPKRKFATKVYAELFRDKEFRREFLESVRKILTAGRGMAPVLMAREVAERLEGPVTQNLNITGKLQLTLADAVAQARQRRDNGPKLLKDADAA